MKCFSRKERHMLISRGFRAARSRGFTRIVAPMNVAFSMELNEVVFDDH